MPMEEQRIFSLSFSHNNNQQRTRDINISSKKSTCGRFEQNLLPSKSSPCSKTFITIISILHVLTALLAVSLFYFSSSLSRPFNPKMSPHTDVTGHSELTLELAKQEHAEHMEGMDETAEEMKKRPMIVKAYALDDPNAPSGANVKTVHFVRHGQGFHNLMADLAKAEGRKWVQHSKTPENPYFMPEVLDAPLTEKGRQQALSLQPTVQSMKDQPELIVLSPNCRAVQTGVLVFEHLRGKVPFLAHEMVREENGVHVCDKRRTKSRQTAEFPMVDFSLLETEEDVIFSEDFRESKLDVANRAYKFFEWLSTRSEKNVGVASHSAWLLTAFNANFQCDESLKGWFQTGEMRGAILEFLPAKE